MNLRELTERPFIHVHASPACNLACSYCSLGSLLKSEVEDDFLTDRRLLDLLETIPPTHFYVSGGEPFIHPGLPEFMRRAGANGHRVTFDTNLAIGEARLEKLLASWEPSWVGYFNISHHVLSGIPLESMLRRAKHLRDANIPLYVKYIAAPEILPQIRDHMDRLREARIGAAATVLMGAWKGRTLPADYGEEETVRLLDLMTLESHALQVFGGVHSRGLACRGGNDAVTWNMLDDAQVQACCHASAFPLSLDETAFATGRRQQGPCVLDSCSGYIYFIYGFNGVMDEVDRFEALLTGNWDYLGAKPLIDSLINLVRGGHRFVDHEKFVRTHAAVNGAPFHVAADRGGIFGAFRRLAGGGGGR